MASAKKRASRKAQHRKAPQSPARNALPRTVSRPDQRSPWRYAIWVAGGVIVGLLAAIWVWNLNGNEPQVAVPISSVDAPDYHALLIDPEDGDRVQFGSHAGIQNSGDGGLTWEPGTLLGVDAMILASSPVEPDRIYAAGHDVFQVSLDRGATWQEVSHNLPGTDIHGFAQHPTDPQRLYAFVVGFGGWTSGDRGATWQAFGSQPPGSGGYLVLASDGEALYAATDMGISRSRDHGTTWNLFENQPGEMTFFSLAVSAANPDFIYAGTPVGVVRSTDQGESWSLLSSPNVMVLGVAASSSNAELLMVLDDEGNIYRSTDGGETWVTPPR